MNREPRLVLGECQLVKLPDDTRPAYHAWQHMRLDALQPTGVFARLFGPKPAMGCRAWIEFTPHQAVSYLDRSVFTFGFYSQIATAMRAGETAFIPVYLPLTEPTPHPLYPDIELPPGVYQTGGIFLFHPDLAASQRLAPGDYRVYVHVQTARQEISTDFPLVVPVLEPSS